VNSVLQALYFCKPFREKIIQYKIAYNQRTGNLSMLDTANPNDTNNNNSQLTNSNLSGNMNLNGNNAGSSNGSANNNGTTGGNGQAQVPILKQEHLLNCLAELFYSIVTMKKKKGIVQPKKFIARLRKDNGKYQNIQKFLSPN
jgi:hypothetical protein